MDDAKTIDKHKITVSNAEPSVQTMEEGEIYLKY